MFKIIPKIKKYLISKLLSNILFIWEPKNTGFIKTNLFLPEILLPNTVYFVKINDTIDIYVTDLSGNIAYKHNSSENEIQELKNEINTINKRLERIETILLLIYN